MPVPTLDEIHKIERGELPRPGHKANPKPVTADQALALKELRKAAADANAMPSGDGPATDLQELLELGVDGGPALTMAGLIVLELLESPFLQQGPVEICGMDTARAVWAFAGGANGAEQLQAALTMQVAGDRATDPDLKSRLLIQGCMLQAAWDANALRAFEALGRGKAAVDAALVVRIELFMKKWALLP
jgi:hypothetical protein